MGKENPENRMYPGRKIGHLTVIQRVRADMRTKSPNLRRRVLVECVCGTRETIPVYYLIRANPKTSCGCMNKGLPTLHKEEYKCWYMMNVRCEDPNHVAYKDYGGRGIKVCERWSFHNDDGFKNFLEDMPKRPSREYSLDREAVNGNYEPGNVRWATAQQQANNQRKHLPKDSKENNGG